MNRPALFGAALALVALVLTAAACDPPPGAAPPASAPPPSAATPPPPPPVAPTTIAAPATARTALPEIRKLSPEERKKHEDKANRALGGGWEQDR